MPAPRERGPTLEIGRPPQNRALGRAQFDDADNTEVRHLSQACGPGAFVPLGTIADRVVGRLAAEDGP